MQSALHAAISTLPHLRRGLTPRSAALAVPHLRTLTGAAAIALADTRAVLAIEGKGREQVRPGDLLSRLLARTPDDHLHVVPRLISSDPACPLRSAVLAPLTVQGRRVGTLIAFYKATGPPGQAELRVVAEAASLVAAQVELSALIEQEERLAHAELRALRAQISPHFVYNALAAVANSIHTRPEEARELLTEFAEFTRYAFRGNRSYVTLADELHYVEKYLRLERARFGDRLVVRVNVAPEVLHAVVPVLSLQPLVENAVRHGVNARQRPLPRRDRRCGPDADVELTARDAGGGMAASRRADALAGRGGGIGLANVNARLQSTFGVGYGLQVHSSPGAGTAVRILCAEVPQPGCAPRERAARAGGRRRAPGARHLHACCARRDVGDVACAASGEEALQALASGDVRRGLPRRADAGPRRPRPRARAAQVRRPPAFVFVSAYESAAVEAFELRAVDYLLKPVSRARVEEALDRFVAGRHQRRARALGPGRGRPRRRRGAGRGRARRRHAPRATRLGPLPAGARRLHARRSRPRGAT